MTGGLVFCELISKILKTGAPIHKELALLNMVLDQIELHVHGLAMSLLDGEVGDAGHSTISGFDRGWRLWMSHFCKSVLYVDGFLAIDKKSTNFGFGR